MAVHITTATFLAIIDEISMIEVALSCNDQHMRNQFVDQIRIDRLKINVATLEATLNTRDDTNDATAAAITGLTQQVAALQNLINERKQAITLPDVVVPASALVTLTLGERTVSNLPCVGLKSTDVLLLTIKSMPVNYGLRSWTPGNDVVASIKLQMPILALAGPTITFAATAFR